MGYDCVSRSPSGLLTMVSELQKKYQAIFYKRIRSLREFFRDDVRDVGSPFSRSRISDNCRFSDAIDVSERLLIVPNCTELSENEFAKFLDDFEFFVFLEIPEFSESSVHV